MKRIAALLGILALSGTFAGASEGDAGHKNPGPCAKIAQACKSAGFVKGDAKKGNGLQKDCVAGVLAGKTVKGISVDAGTIQACKDKRADKKAERKAKKKQK